MVPSTAESASSSADSAPAATRDPLLIRAARGETTERTPVWMMRQAGRHIKEYRDLCAKYPTFRMRSEIPEVAVEVSLQPWRNYKTDGCILFSDILTPLPGMGCEFTIDEKLGPLMEPCRTWDDIQKVRFPNGVITITYSVDRVRVVVLFQWCLALTLTSNHLSKFYLPTDSPN